MHPERLRAAHGFCGIQAFLRRGAVQHLLSLLPTVLRRAAEGFLNMGGIAFALSPMLRGNPGDVQSAYRRD